MRKYLVYGVACILATVGLACLFLFGLPYIVLHVDPTVTVTVGPPTKYYIGDVLNQSPLAGAVIVLVYASACLLTVFGMKKLGVKLGVN